MIVKLSKSQYDYLTHSLPMEKKIQWSIFERNDSDEKISLEFKNDIADEIRDWAIERQQRVGFDTNYGLTPEGKTLQELIDTFYVE